MENVEAKWWYIHGFAGDLAFSHAAFAWKGGWRVHTTVKNRATGVRIVATEDSKTGYTSSLISIRSMGGDPEDTHSLPRTGGRRHIVAPFAEATLSINGAEEGTYPVWYEVEDGPIDVTRGWRWLAVRNGDVANLWYAVDGTHYTYEFTKGGGRVEKDFPILSILACADDLKLDVVNDPEMGITYTESPFWSKSGNGFYEEVGPRSLGGMAMRAQAERMKAQNMVEGRLEAYALNDRAAGALLVSLYRASQLADDIADCDERPDRVTDVMRILGVEVPRNPFFRAHADVLTATLAQVIDAWEWSNEHEDDPDETGKVLAYGLRDAAIMYVRQVAFLVGGHEHAKEVFADAIRFFHGPGGVEPFRSTR